MASLIIFIIRWAAVLTLLYSLYGLFLKRETLYAVNRMVLLLILGASMALPLVQIETKESNPVVREREKIEQQIVSVQLLLADSGQPAADSRKESKAPAGSLENSLPVLLLTGIYIIGAAAAWLSYLSALGSLLLLVRQARRVAIAGMPPGVTVLTHPAIHTPGSWMKWIFVTPEDAGVRSVLRHELAHVRHGHSWDMLLCELTCRTLWFLPFAWMLRQDLRDVHEFQADRSVLQSNVNADEYQMLLIRKASSAGLQPVVNAFNQSQIKRRLSMMYRKPSKRWMALKAVYLLPLSALALVAFARPQVLGEIEERVGQGVAKAMVALSATEAVTTVSTGTAVTSLPATRLEPDTVAVMPDSNLVKADLNEAGNSGLQARAVKTPVELLDSTMEAVGAHKIADGIYVGHFQPSLDSDTVRIATLTVRDRQSQETGSHRFGQNADSPYAYDITLNAETRKERTGYYIRYLKPVSSTLRHYDRKPIDEKKLSTDSVLTRRSSSSRLPYMTPIAIQRGKKDTRLFMYIPLTCNDATIETFRRDNTNFYSDLAIVDEKTHDKYVCRAIDYSYFKYVKSELMGSDTLRIYQACFVFPPLAKGVKEVHFGSTKYDDIGLSQTFWLDEIPRKGRVITN